MDNVSLSFESAFFDDIYVDEEGVLRFKTLLAGEWVGADVYGDVYSPIDGSTIARVPRLSWEAIDPVLEKVYARGRWTIRDIPGKARLEFLYAIADLMEEHSDDMAQALIVNAGKTRSQANGEVRGSIDRLREADLELRRISGEYIPGDWSRHTLESEGIVRREAYGVVLAINPFNYPLFDAVNKFAYSVVPGNAFVVKPSSVDPIPTLLFAKMVEEAGFPKEAFAVLSIPGRESDKLVSDRRIQVISLTGSTETGLKVLRKAGIKQLIMELGGGDPAIVLEDADLDLTSSKTVAGLIGYCGQRCDAIKLVLVEEPVYDALREKLVAELAKVKVGDPRDPSTTMGPLIDSGTTDEVVDATNEAQEKGGKLLYGGKRLGATYIEPTLIEVTDKGILKQLRLYRDEIFAPVALITSIDGVDEAIELVNGRRYGLDAAIFGRDIDEIRKLIRFLEVGAIYINEFPRHGIGYYPFGGRKDSGIGREGIGYSIDSTTALKTIVYNYRGKGIWEYM